MLRTHTAKRRFRLTPRSGFEPRIVVLEDRLTPSHYSLTSLNATTGTVYMTGINNSGQIAATDYNNSTRSFDVVFYNNG